MRNRELAEQLVAKADQDLFVMDKLLTDPKSPQETIGFHAQQAAEKPLKAVLAAHAMEYPRTHRLAELLDALSDAGAAPPPAFEQLRFLTPYAVAFRYEIVSSCQEPAPDWATHRSLLQRLRAWTVAVTGDPQE
jgi:HEPN domain-containing protein